MRGVVYPVIFNLYICIGYYGAPLIGAFGLGIVMIGLRVYIHFQQFLPHSPHGFHHRHL
jgi:hypothetical protein